MKSFLSLTLLLILPLQVTGQDMSNFFFSAGRSYSNLEKLYAFTPLIEGQEGSEFHPGDQRTTFGFGSRVGGWQSRIGFYIEFSSAKNEQAIVSTQLRESLFELDYSRGLVKFGGKSLGVLAPSLGVGLGRSYYDLQQANSVEWEEVLVNPGSSTTLKKTSLVLDLALVLDYVLRIEDFTDEYGFGFIVKGGYRVAPLDRGWKRVLDGFDSDDIGGVPDFTTFGPYWNISIGF